jgi:hypothetical protein
MKKTLLSLFAVVLVGFAAYAADTNTASSTLFGTNSPSLSLTNAPAETGTPMELTFGGSGLTNPKSGHTEFAFDLTYSFQPLKQPIWFGISQELGWSPALEGATDLDAAWAWSLIKDKLYLDTGWSAGAVYDRSSLGWRTGPEIELEYYTKGNAFIYAGINYDLLTHTAADGWTTAKGNPLRFDFGIGIAF